jgi:hypothetical protein
VEESLKLLVTGAFDLAGGSLGRRPAAGRTSLRNLLPLLLLVLSVGTVAEAAESRGLPAGIPGSAPTGMAASGAVPRDPGAEWWKEVRNRLAESEYEASWVAGSPTGPGGLQAPNRFQGFRTWFSEGGIRVVPRLERDGSWFLAIATERFGRTNALGPTLPAEVAFEGGRVVLRRGELVESWENGKGGLRMTLRFAAPPREADSGPIELTWRLSGDLRSRIGDDERSVEWSPSSGGRALALSGIVARDGAGRSLPVRIEGRVLPGSSGLTLVVDDRGSAGPIEIEGLLSGAAWSLDGEQDSMLLGASVFSAGDVDNDGYSDVIVGAPGYGPSLAGQGGAFVFRGSASGLSTTASWSRLGAAAGDNLGSAVATAGDVNNDGYADVVVGACACIGRSPAGAGRAEIFLGGSGGLSATPFRTLDATTTDEAMGASVGTAGDVNGDGYSDVVVGSPDFSNGETGEGRVRLWHGGASMSTTPAWSFEANVPASRLGGSVGTAGDLNGDGYSDMVVGAGGWSNGNASEGGSWVFHGSGSGLSSTPAWSAEGGQDDARFGSSVSSAGDVNGDGYSDLLVGAPGWDGTNVDEGKAVVYLGSATGLATSPAWSRVGGAVGASFGFSVAVAGDVNGDGFADVVVGAPGASNGESNEGRAVVFEGGASGLTTNPSWSWEPDAADSRAGVSVGPAGDVNGDGYSDVVVGLDAFDLPGFTDAGRAVVFHGGPGALSVAASWNCPPRYPVQTGQRMGATVGSAGDVNNDGYGDVFVAAPLFDDGQADEGEGWVFLGSATGLGTTPHWADEGNQIDARFGASVAAGDVNGDGYGDLVVGVAGSSSTALSEGKVVVYLGSSLGLASPATVASSFTAHQAGSHLGSTLAVADFNGDSIADIVVGAPDLGRGQANEGGVYVLYGSAVALPTVEALAIESNQEGAHLGAALASGGDVNGDGYSDFLVGAPGWDASGPGSDEGGVRVYFGSANGIDDQNPALLTGTQAGESFGSSLSSAGDVDGNRFSDLVIGSPGYDAPGPLPDAGRAVVLAGSASGIQTTPIWTRDGAAAGDRLGAAVALAGDLNGDGYSDFAVGSPFADHPESDEGIVEVFAGSAAGPGSSPIATLEVDSANATFGAALGGAVDANGDGYADLLVGAPLFEEYGSTVGKAFLFYGNGSIGRSLLPRQTRISSPYQLIPELGHSDSPTSFRLRSIGRSPFGRAKVQLETEALPFGTVFTGTGTGLSTVQDSGVGGFEFNEMKSSLTQNSLYHWRERLRFTRARTPLLPATRWFTLPRSGWNEADLRTRAQTDLTITGTQSPLNPLVGDEMTYVITMQNTGTAPAHFSRFRDYFFYERYVSPPNLVDTPGALSCSAMTLCTGTCPPSSWATGYIFCEYGTIPAGETRVATLKWDIGQASTIRNRAEISSPEVYDPTSSNNYWDVSTTATGAAIGDRAWWDQDDDGVQDAGEPGLAGVTMRLFNGSGVEIDAQRQLTGSLGSFLFSGSEVTRYLTYSIGADEPTGYRRTLKDQGGDDNRDSDLFQTTGRTSNFTLASSIDALRWDAGFVTACQVAQYAMVLPAVTDDGADRPILSFVEGGAGVPWYRKTGYDVLRSTALPPTWNRVGVNVQDQDGSRPGIQWTDPGNTTLAETVYYYETRVYNSYCGAPPAGEGP